MSNFIIYGLQIMLIQAFFLLVYQMLLDKETFFKWNRFYLLGTILFSFIVPFITISVFKNANQFVQLNEVVLYNKKSNEITMAVKNQLDANSVVFYVYLFGLILFMVLFFIKLRSIWKLKKNAKVMMYNKNKIYVLKHSNQAFSFLNFIFIGEKNKSNQVILNHELVHKSKKHSVDLLFLEITRILFWFNPMLLVYQNKLTEVHEFEADATVVKLDKVEYFESIINQIFQVRNWSFTNDFFNQSLIKKRIVMLQKSKSKKSAVIKYVLVVPMLLLSILFFSNCVEKEEDPSVYRTNIVEGDETVLVKKEETISFERFENVDETPRFKDCEDVADEETLACFNEQLNLHIKKNFAYPEVAAEENIQGRVAIQFIIDEEGNVTNVMAKGPKNGKLLEEEAIRIVEALPQFIPAKLNGKCVNVKYGLPITFKLM
ncbi:TonB family protein [Flavobacterium jejuense]|uniref:TonB family protein n=1 Tax=Flavobacterium jejuense TaxID=1544455 RepID=A0ABX0ISA9_9FLAO|nr:M56 family metallopeptidase [Flavobacterium jejuense]NHN26588.1 TonB family protein [Flavobacterium jejuense]